MVNRQKWVRRHLTPRILEALADTPVVLLHGARQSGKSTLASHIASEHHPARYLTLDDATVFSAAQRDAQAFLSAFEGPLVIDEVQRVPELFLALKTAVDRDRAPGRFLLTGSTHVLLLPRLADSLAGRMEVLTLWPLSCGEIGGVEEQFLPAAFSEKWHLPETGPGRTEIVPRLLTGGYPEPLFRVKPARRGAWFGSYLTTILQRDIRDLADIEGLTEIPRLLALLGSQVGSLLNVSELSRDSGVPHTTLKRYLSLLQGTFLVFLLPAWAGNVRKRLIKSPKPFFVDTGLLAHLAGFDSRRLRQGPDLLGPLLENFVAAELLKQASWSYSSFKLFYYRTAAREEVDLVLEDSRGRLVGIEVKAGQSVNDRDFRGLDDLKKTVGRRFHRGFVLYLGADTVPFGKELFALPVSALWSLAGPEAKSARPLKRRSRKPSL